MARAYKDWTVTFRMRYDPGKTKDEVLMDAFDVRKAVKKASDGDVQGMVVRRRQQ